MSLASKIRLRKRRSVRIRSQIIGNSKRPRLCVFRSNSNIYAQIIDDAAGKTITGVDDRQIKKISQKELSAKVAKAYEVGLQIGKIAQEKNITEVVFDRSGYRYHGRVKALADGARASGLKF